MTRELIGEVEKKRGTGIFYENDATFRLLEKSGRKSNCGRNKENGKLRVRHLIPRFRSSARVF